MLGFDDKSLQIGGFDPETKDLSFYEIAALYKSTFLDDLFQRRGGVERGSGWTISQSRSYVDSLLKQRAFNDIMLVDAQMALLNAKAIGCVESTKYFQEVLDSGFRYVSVDGNNSSSTINGFLNNTKGVYYETTNPSIKYFKDFTESDRYRILHSSRLKVTILRKITVFEMTDLFRKRNTSTKLNPQEYRQARLSSLASFIRDISNEQDNRDALENMFFASPAKSFDARKHEECIAALCLKHDTNFTSDLSKKYLDSFYEATTDLKAATEKKIKNLLDELAQMASTSWTQKLTKGQLANLFDFLDLVLKDHKIKDHAKLLKYFLEIDAKWAEEAKKIIEEEKEEKSYSHWTKFYYQEVNYNKIRKKLKKTLTKDIPGLIKDGVLKLKRTSKDAYTFEEKKTLHSLQERTDRNGDEISLTDLYEGGKYEADHMKSVSNGGPTNLSNGELMTKEDNRKKGAQDNEPHYSYQQGAGK